jgi:bifunctional non-homologous end joining protein LigD
MFGVDREEIAITRNASESLEILLMGMDFKPGDEILTTTQDYPRMLTTLHQRERREGLVLKMVKIPIPPKNLDEITAAFEKGITSRTKLILVSHQVNITGQITPVKAICELARAKGVETVVDGARVRMWTRGRQDAARYFGLFLEPPTWIGARRAIVDGEVIALDPRGEPDFALLQARIKGRRGAAAGSDAGSAAADGGSAGFVYQVFDLMHLDGRSLLEAPLDERRALLAKTLRPDPRVRLSESIERDGLAFFELARARGLEGIMAKDRRSPYLPGARSTSWQKVKIRPEQELVVGGWATGLGRAVDLGTLLVGVYERGALRYAGKIGAGFTNDARAELLPALAALAAEDPPFDPAPPKAASRNANWVRPELVIRAEFAGWTGDGLVRQAAYRGIDLEKDPKVVRREAPPSKDT